VTIYYKYRDIFLTQKLMVVFCYFLIEDIATMSKKNPGDYDEHIIDALLKLDNPIIGKGGKRFYIRDKARNESGLEHIAAKRHRLKVRDVELVTKILRHPIYMCDDPTNRIYRNYYGIREGKDSNSFLKIVTSPVKGKRNEEEVIVTIFPTKSLK